MANVRGWDTEGMGKRARERGGERKRMRIRNCTAIKLISNSNIKHLGIRRCPRARAKNGNVIKYIILLL